MHPILIKLGPLSVFSYGFMLMLGFVAGTAWAWWAAPRANCDRQRVLDLALFVLLGALLGSRLLYVLLNWKDYAGAWLELFRVWEGGLSLHGGVLGALLASAYYLHKHQANFWDYADLFAPGVALGTVLGRFGCTLNGCCHGGPTTGWWGITSRFAPGVKVIPTQLMEAAGCLVLFFLLAWLFGKRTFGGQVFLGYLMGYSIVRSVVEIWRAGYTAQYFWGPVTQAQAASAVIFLLALVGYLRLRRGNRLEAGR